MSAADRRCERLIQDGRVMDALLWLSKGSDRGFTLGQFDESERARRFVRRIVETGAKSVLVVDMRPHPKTGFEYSDQLLVELPDEPPKRAALLAWSRSIGHEPGDDVGQRYLLVQLGSLIH